MFQVCQTKIGWFDRKIVKNSLFTACLDNDNSAQECPRLIDGIKVLFPHLFYNVFKVSLLIISYNRAKMNPRSIRDKR